MWRQPMVIRDLLYSHPPPSLLTLSTHHISSPHQPKPVLRPNRAPLSSKLIPSSREPCVPPSHPKSPLGPGLRQDAATSTTDLSGEGAAGRERESGAAAAAADSHDGTPRKVQKVQINALAKMLSALRR